MTVSPSGQGAALNRSSSARAAAAPVAENPGPQLEGIGQQAHGRLGVAGC